MEQVSLYRKYRPKSFNEVCGQDLVINILKNSLKLGKISHSYLFSGERGTGKTTTARIFAKAVNCLNLQDGEPCNQCANCQQINEESFLDIIEIDAASNNSVDQIRQLKDTVYYLPSQGKYKVYIIDEAHMITNQGFNAFLKTLEEPPPHVIFILATTEPEKILKTIHSRCTRFIFNRVEKEVLEKHLIKIAQKEGYSLSKEAAYQLAIAADGSVRDALTLLQELIYFATDNSITEDLVKNSLGFVTKSEIEELFLNLEKGNLERLFQLATSFSRRRLTLNSIINSLISYLDDKLYDYREMDLGKINVVLKASDYLLHSLTNLKQIRNNRLFLQIVFFNLFSIWNEVETLGKEKLEVKKESIKSRFIEDTKPLKSSLRTTNYALGEEKEKEKLAQFGQKELVIFLEKLKREKRLLSALLKEVKTFYLKEEKIVFEFQPQMSFHVRILNKYKTFLEESFLKLFKVKLELEFINLEEPFSLLDVNEKEFPFSEKSLETQPSEEIDKSLIEEAKNLPEVQQILRMFPGSEIIKVIKKK